MQNKLSTFKYLLISGATAGSIFFIPSVARGSNPLPPPLPTYSPVTSFADTTQVTVPENLRNTWRGKYTLPVFSMMKSGQWTVKDYVQAGFLKRAEFKPQTKTYRYNPSLVYDWTKDIAATVNTESKDPELTIKDGYATHFIAPVVGKQLDRYQSSLKILQNLELNQQTFDLAIITTSPSRDLSKLNDLGINELIGRGESKFSGSPANRRHNIKVGMNKFKGVIIAPDEEFSFNKYLGPVEASAGFLPELVIKGNETIPELGGGLCQVSSTTFRAAMHAGLPITQRKNHSYAVQYYSPQGSDATIYPGVMDLKFKNDTGNSILVWPYFIGNDILVFDFYGTRDGREVKLNQPITYDRKANGAMKATWTRTVTKNGISDTDSFSSTYQPPELFHKKEEFVANPESPTTTNPNESPTNTAPPTNDTTTTPATEETTSTPTTKPETKPNDQV